jgi:hypothetical protein
VNHVDDSLSIRLRRQVSLDVRHHLRGAIAGKIVRTALDDNQFRPWQ